MFYQNVGAPVRSSAVYVAGFGLILLIAGMGYSVYHYRKVNAPPEVVIQPPASMSQRAPGDCTYTRPCTLQLQPDGTTERVSIKVGEQPCFDPPIWANLRGYGYTITSQGGPERLFVCSAEEVLQGKCDQRDADSFRFKPEKGVVPPRYWFISLAQKFC